MAWMEFEQLEKDRIQVPQESLPEGDFPLGELAGRLVGIAERWANDCIAERRVELSEQ